MIVMVNRNSIVIPFGGFLLLYLVSGLAAPLVHRLLWTSKASFDTPPWYFIGEAVVAGILSGLVFLVFILLICWQRRRYRNDCWWLLGFATLWLGVPVFRGVLIAVRCNNLMDEASAATEFASHAELVSGTLSWLPVVLSCVTAVVIGLTVRKQTLPSEQQNP